MKKRNYLPLAFLLLTVVPDLKNDVTVVGNQQGNLKSLSLFRQSLPEGEKVSWHISVPTGTITEIKDNHLTMTMPEGTEIWGLNWKTQQFEQLSRAGYNCTCESRDGKCRPFVAGNQVGCVTGQDAACSRCVGTKTSNTMLFSEFSRVYYVHSISPEDMSNLDGFAGIRPIHLPEYIQKLPPVTEDILADPEVEAALQSIRENYRYDTEADFSDGNVPDGYSLIPVNIKEHLAYIVIPSARVEPGMIEVAVLNFEGAELAAVTCSGCTGSCVLKTRNFGLVKYCDGCNSGCTIHF